MKNIKVNTFLSIKTQYENLGDAFIIASLIENISRRSTLYVDVSRCPSEFIDTLKSLLPTEVNFLEYKGATFVFFLKVLLSQIKQHKTYYFMIPGGFSGEKTKATIFKGEVYNLLLNILKIIGVKISQVGMSYDNLGKNHIQLLKNRAKLIHYHFPRDKQTCSYLKELNIPFSGVIPDMAFNQFSGFLDKYKSSSDDRNKIVFSFRVDKNPATKEQIKIHIRNVIETLPVTSNYVFLSQVKRDDTFAAECFEEMKNLSRNSELILHEDKFSTYFDIFNKTLAVYSNRLHCLLISARFGALAFPVIKTKENQKIVGIWHDIGHAEDLITLENNEHLFEQKLNNARTIDFNKLNKELDNVFNKMYS